MHTPSALFISESRRFLPYGKAEPFRYWITTETRQDGITLFSDVAGPFDSLDQAEAMIPVLKSDRHKG